MENFDDKTFSLVCGHQISTADGVVLREQQYQKTLKSEDEEDQSKKVEIFHKKSIGDSLKDRDHYSFQTSFFNDL